jgi:hypothetical protein
MAIEGLACAAIGCVKTRQGEDTEHTRGVQFRPFPSPDPSRQVRQEDSGAAPGRQPKLVASRMWSPTTYFEKVRTKPPHVIKMPATTPGKEAGSWNFTLAMTCAMRKNKTT